MTHKCDGCRYASEHQEMGFRPFGVCSKETNLIEAEQSYNAECCPYIVDAYANGTAEELKEVFDDLKGKTETKDFQEAVEGIQRVIQVITEMLNPILEKALETIKKVSDAILSLYPSKRVLRLALHHPKKRIRKKNIHRIMRDIERWGKENEN